MGLQRLKLPRASSGLWVLLGTIGAAALSFAFQAVLSLVLSDADFGSISSAIVWALAASVLAAMGAQNVMLDFVKSGKQSPAAMLGTFRNVWGIHALIAAILVGLTWLVVPVMYSQILFILVFAMMLSLLTTLGAARQSTNDFRGVGVFLVVPELAKLVALAVLMVIGFNTLEQVHLLLGVTYLLISVLLFFVFMWRGASVTTGPSYATVLSRGVPYALSSVMFMIYYRSPLAVLTFQDQLSEAGSLAIIYLFMTAILLLPTAYSQKFLLGRWHAIPQEDHQTFAKELRGQLTRITLFSLPIAVIVYFFAEPLLHFVYEGRYSDAQTYASWFSIVFLLRALCIPLQTATSVDDLKWGKTLCIFVAATLTLGGSILLTPSFGLQGAFWAGLGAEAVLLLSLTLVALRRVRGKRAALPLV